MYRSIVLRCAAAYLFCARPILDTSRPISAPSGMMVRYGSAATVAKNELDPEGLYLIDFFSRRPERGRPADTRPQRGGKGDQVGGQVSPGHAGATENRIQQGTPSPRQHDQCAARQQTPLDSARDLRQDDALDEARALEAKGLDEEALLIVSSVILSFA